MMEPALTDIDFHGGVVDRRNYERHMDIDMYIERWSQALNLVDWEFRFDPTDPNKKDPERWQARSSIRDNEKIVQIRIDPNLPESQLEGAIAHELLHMALRPYLVLAQTFAGQHKTGQMLLDVLHDKEEEVIETLVRALLPTHKRWLPYGSLAKTWPAFAE